MGDGGHIGAHEHKLGPTQIAWNLCQSLITSCFNDVGVLQKKLVPFLRVKCAPGSGLERLKEDLREGVASTDLAAGLRAVSH